MLSSFHVASRVWLPDRFTVGFAARVNDSFVIEQLAASAVQVATVLYAAAFSAPALPTAFCHALGPDPGPWFQLTSAAFQVTAPADGGVNDDAFARIEILSCFVAVNSTMPSTANATFPFVVLADTSVTVNEIPAGTVIRACSATAAVSVVVCVASVRGTVVCATAVRPGSTDSAAIAMATLPMRRSPGRAVEILMTLARKNG
jgi:hypothetical protein